MPGYEANSGRVPFAACHVFVLQMRNKLAQFPPETQQQLNEYKEFWHECVFLPAWKILKEEVHNIQLGSLFYVNNQYSLSMHTQFVEYISLTEVELFNDLR